MFHNNTSPAVQIITLTVLRNLWLAQKSQQHLLSPTHYISNAMSLFTSLVWPEITFGLQYMWLK